MKKSIILMLVFGVAAMANAALQISVNGNPDPVDSEITIVASETLILDVHTTPLPYTGTYLLMVVDAAEGTLSGGYPLSGLLSYVRNDYACSFMYYAGITTTPYCYNPPTSGIAGSVADSDSSTTFEGLIYDGIEFHCEAPGDAVISLYRSPDSVNWTLDDLLIIHQGPPAPTPLIGVEPYTLDFFVEENGVDPDDQVLSVWNDGVDILNWTITESCDWLTATPMSGISTGEPNDVTLSVDISGLGQGFYSCDLTVSDPCAANSPQTVTVNLTNECIFDDSPMYDDWVGAGKNWDRPDCWCYERHCRGDVDGCKVGLFWVQTNDLVIFANAYTKGDAKMDQAKICADFDHKKVGLFRVQTDDLVIFANYYTKGELKVPVCPLDWEATYTYPMTDPPTPGTPDGDDDYNFWVVPDSCL